MGDCSVRLSHLLFHSESLLPTVATELGWAVCVDEALSPVAAGKGSQSREALFCNYSHQLRLLSRTFKGQSTLKHESYLHPQITLAGQS